MAPLRRGSAAERLGDAHLLARRAQIDARAPMEPVGTRQEAVVPARLRVELAEHDQQLVGGGMQARGQLGDGLAELFDRREVGRASRRTAIGSGAGRLEQSGGVMGDGNATIFGRR